MGFIKMKLFLLFYICFRSVESLDMTSIMSKLPPQTMMALGQEISMTELMAVDGSLFEGFSEEKMMSVFMMDPKALKQFFAMTENHQKLVTANLRITDNSVIQGIKENGWLPYFDEKPPAIHKEKGGKGSKVKLPKPPKRGKKGGKIKAGKKKKKAGKSKGKKGFKQNEDYPLVG